MIFLFDAKPKLEKNWIKSQPINSVVGGKREWSESDSDIIGNENEIIVTVTMVSKEKM